MAEKHTSVFENGLIWFGAGVSIAEILTGTYFASLGFFRGIFAIIIGIKNLGKVNTVAMTALFILTIILSFIIFGKGTALSISGEGITFGAAVELSVAMPLSWLPLISDYTREADKPVKATAVSTAVYGLVSCWMYVIGMGAAIFTAESDIAAIMLKAGLGIFRFKP